MCSENRSKPPARPRQRAQATRDRRRGAQRRGRKPDWLATSPSRGHLALWVVSRGALAARLTARAGDVPETPRERPVSAQGRASLASSHGSGVPVTQPSAGRLGAVWVVRGRGGTPSAPIDQNPERAWLGPAGAPGNSSILAPGSLGTVVLVLHVAPSWSPAFPAGREEPPGHPWSEQLASPGVTTGTADSPGTAPCVPGQKCPSRKGSLCGRWAWGGGQGDRRHRCSWSPSPSMRADSRGQGQGRSSRRAAGFSASQAGQRPGPRALGKEPGAQGRRGRREAGRPLPTPQVQGFRESFVFKTPFRIGEDTWDKFSESHPSSQH